MPTRLFAILALLFLPSLIVRAETTSYERDVRPILKEHCFQCHGEAGEVGGGLDLRLRRLIAKGGESGTAFVEGKADDSLLYQRVRDGEMPPEEIKHRPNERELAILADWINNGAPALRDEPDDLDPSEYITDEEASFWSFQPVERPMPPSVTQEDRVRTPIDRFVLSQLEANGLRMSSDADRHTLLRRAYFGLTGLPPSPEQAREFRDDDAPDAYERLIETLLESPHYGERWGRHWLDVAGYADSEGYTESDPVRPNAWKYRDYVIRSINEDKPFDQFIVEQLAGDELVEPPYENLTPDAIEKLTATGFLRTAPDGTASGGTNRAIASNNMIAKTIEVVSTSLLGLTVGCAECHDHRYDPILQADYYSLRAIFEPALDWKAWKTPSQRRLSLYTDADRQQAKEIEAKAQAILAERTKKQEAFIQRTFDKEVAKLPEGLREPAREARATDAKKRTPEQQKLLKEHPSLNVSAGSLYLYDRKAADELKAMADEANKVRGTKPKEEFLRVLTEVADKQPPLTFLFARGDHEQPKQELPPSELRVLTSYRGIDITPNDPERKTTGRRLAYARWLTSGEHPLVARVLVNRVWLHHFGRGLVGTAGDFGALGVPPTHPRLLDWLASEFVASGWSLKHLHRLVMKSSVYRQASFRRPEAVAIDSDNLLLWRMPVRRLEAEVVRDSLLAVSGKLNMKAGGPPVPVMADRVGMFVIGKENLNAGRPGAVIPMNGEEFRRSVYIQVRRSRPLSVMEPFDLPTLEPNCTSRSSSTVAPQALLMMNSEQVLARASDLADRVLGDAADDREAQVRRAWQIVFASQPSDEELSDATAFLAAQSAYFAANKPAGKKEQESHNPDREALASLCHALVSSNAFLYVD